MSTQRRLLLTLLVAAAAGLVPGAEHASAELSLEQRCIAGGLVLPVESRGYTFNHHPEKDREIRATDNFLAPAEIATEFEAIIADLPAACGGGFSRQGQIKLQFKATGGGGEWRPIRNGWEEIHWGERYLDPPKPTLVEHRVLPCGPRESGPPGFPEYAVEEPTLTCDSYVVREYSSSDPPRSPFVSFRSQQNIGSLGLGCATASRARIKLSIVNDATKAIAAVRLINVTIPVESWYQARCLGKFSIQDKAAARRCPQRAIGAVPGGPPTVWGVKSERVSCARASAVAQEALQEPAFSQGLASPQDVGDWHCFFARRGAVTCLQGAKRVHLTARRSVRERCEGAPRGVKRLGVAETSCEVAFGLLNQIQLDPSKDPFEMYGLGSDAWSCAYLQRFDSDDRVTLSYHCFAGKAMVGFEIAASKDRVVPVEPAVIAAEVILPGTGPAALFALTPEMKFGERVKWTRHEALLPIEVEPALVGRRAQLELVEFKAECTWTADQGQTSPICPTSKRVGASRRTVSLKASQLIHFVPRKHRGNWLYRLTIKTPPFSYNGLSYRRTSHSLTASVVNEAANCEINPWCHPNKKRDGDR